MTVDVNMSAVRIICTSLELDSRRLSDIRSTNEQSWHKLVFLIMFELGVLCA